MRFRLALLAALLIVLALAVRALRPRSEEPGSPAEPAADVAAGRAAVPPPAPGEPQAEEPDEAPAVPEAEATVVSEEGEPLGDYRIGGVVVTPDGAPVAGAEVMLDPPFDDAVTVRTGADGQFAFSGLAGDTSYYLLEASASGHPPVRASGTPGRTDLRIVVGATWDVAGIVVFPDGTPAAGAAVRLGSREVLTGEDGRFRFAGAPAVPDQIRATLGAYPRFGRETAAPPRWSAYLLVFGEGYSDLRIGLRPTERSFVRVRVVDQSGAPQAGIDLYYPLWPVSDGPSGEEGRITIALGAAPGQRVRVATRDTRRESFRPSVWFEATSAATPEAAEEVSVVLPSPRRVTLVAVQEDGSPLPPDVTATFELSVGRFQEDPEGPRGHDRATYLVQPDADIPPFLKVEAPGYVLLRTRLRPPDRVHEIRYPLARGATVVGRLVTGSGRTVFEGTVEAWVGHRSLGVGTSRGTAGEFRVEGLPSGPTLLAAIGPDGMRGAVREVVLAAGETLDVGEVRLAAPVRLRFLVTDGAGRPVGGARIVRGEEFPGFYPDETHSHADGRFDMVVPADFSARLLASREGFGTVAVAVDARDAGREIPVVLAPEARLLLHVLRPSPGTGWSWHVRLPGESFSWQPEEIAGSTKDARLVGGLPPGRLVVFIESAGGVNEAEVVLRAGETAEVTLEIP